MQAENPGPKGLALNCPKEAVRNPSDGCICHSEPSGKLRTGSAKRGIVILSPALGGTKDLEILRLTPQNDVGGQPPKGALGVFSSHGSVLESSQFGLEISDFGLKVLERSSKAA